MISFQHCDSGVPITVEQDPVTGGWSATVDDIAEDWQCDPEDIAEAERECQRIERHLSRDMYADETRGARMIRDTFHHEAEIL